MADNTGKGAPSQPFTAEDLAKAVVPGKDINGLQLAGGKPIDEQRGIAQLDKRLKTIPGVAGDGSHSVTTDMATMIYNALPEALRTEKILDSIDLRPYMAAMNGKQIADQNFASFPDNNSDVYYQVNTKPFVDAETTRIGKVLVEAGKGTQAKASTGYDNSTGSVSPDIAALTTDDPNAAVGGGPTNLPFGLGGADGTGTQTTIGYNPDGTPILATSSTVGGQAGFPVADIQGLVDNGTYDLMQAASREIKEQATNKTGYFPVDVGLMTESDNATGKAIGQRHPQTLSINDSMNYINTLPPSRVEDLQAKLAAGGYFDRLQNGGTYDAGNPFDKNTMAAWQLLLTDSIQQKTPAPIVLGQSMNTYRDSVRKQRLGAISTYDPRYTRAIADDYGQSKIGRDLTDAEAAMLDKYMETIINQRAGYVAGATDNVGDGPLTDQRGYTQNDVELALASNPSFKESERGKNANTFQYKLAQLMH